MVFITWAETYASRSLSRFKKTGKTSFYVFKTSIYQEYYQGETSQWKIWEVYAEEEKVNSNQACPDISHPISRHLPFSFLYTSNLKKVE